MSTAKCNLTQDVLKENLHYDPNTGIFTRVKNHNAYSPGDVAGCCNGEKNYTRIRVGGDRFLAHRLAWLYVYGVWPDDQIDHINCDKTDNRICNLRVVDQSGNMQNRRTPPSRNTSGYLGASRSGGKWTAQIVVNSKNTRLGTFDTAEEAHEAYIKAKRRLHSTCTI